MGRLSKKTVTYLVILDKLRDWVKSNASFYRLCKRLFNLDLKEVVYQALIHTL